MAWDGVCAALNLAQVHLGRHQVAHDGLLRFDRLVGVHDQKFEVGAHGQVLLQNPALENAETFVRIGWKAANPCPPRNISIAGGRPECVAGKSPAAP